MLSIDKFKDQIDINVLSDFDDIGDYAWTIWCNMAKLIIEKRIYFDIVKDII